MQMIGYKYELSNENFSLPFSMDLERGRSLSRTPSSAAVRAVRGSAWLLGNTLVHPVTGAAYAYGLRRGRTTSPPSPQATPKRMRSRSFRRGTSARRSRTRRRPYRSSSLTTNQRDVSQRYSGSGRRRPSRGARRFRYRVMQTVNANQPLSVFCYAKSFNLSTAVNLKGVYGVGLFTTQMTDQTDLKDLLLDAGIDVTAPAPNPQLSGRVVIKSCCLDVQITNRGAKDALIDIYEVMCVKDVPNTDTLTTNFTNMFNQMTTIGAKDWQNPAVSLFENPVFCRHYKIMSKKETQVPAGDLITMQMRVGKDKSISPNSVIAYPNAIPKLARFYVFVYQGIPEDSAGTARLSATTLTISFQKAYKYALMSGRTTAQIRTG